MEVISQEGLRCGRKSTMVSIQNYTKMEGSYSRNATKNNMV